MTEQRLDYIDIAKGLGIILVVCSHTAYPEMMFYTSAFFVPIFFFCSGLTSKKKDITLKENFKHHAIKLLKPYLFFSILLLIYFHDFSLRAFVGIFYSRYSLYPFGTEPDICHFMIVGNYPMWFLTCMVVAYLLYDILVYHEKYQYYLVSLYLVATAAMTNLPILLPWSLDTAPLMAVIMFCGLKIREYVPEIFTKRNPHTLIVLSIILYLLLLPLCYDINISVRMYGPSMPVYLIAAVTGCIGLTFISRLLQNTVLGKGLKQIGIHSLTIFCIEIPFILLGKQLSELVLPDYFSFQAPIITSFIQLTIALIGGYLSSILLHNNKHIRRLFF